MDKRKTYMNYKKDYLVEKLICAEKNVASMKETLNQQYENIKHFRPIVEAYWVVDEYEYMTCSHCGKSTYSGCESTSEANTLKNHFKHFCPDCGAVMYFE